ncbi:hypothetical protein CTEN210_03396 [Chaetoceros tenuissimus]|uniref:Palmitoyltransferase n=1 Tax=Chaetoceros tenuissimus TaxID=426638 RepID=A0AAD3H1A7_9STRA|nr:hypothetical protein CTEN210_03396 [Chaetoceros tenuissimus]
METSSISTDRKSISSLQQSGLPLHDPLKQSFFPEGNIATSEMQNSCSESQVLSPTNTIETVDSLVDEEDEESGLILMQKKDIDSDVQKNPDSPVRRRAFKSAQRFRHWKEHTYAVGLAPISWKLEDQDEELDMMTVSTSFANHSYAIKLRRLLRLDRFLIIKHPSNILCKNFGRIGNMIVIHESNGWMKRNTPIATDETSGKHTTCTTEVSYEQSHRLLVLGPYWATLFGVTLPFITLTTMYAALTAIFTTAPIAFWTIILWYISTVTMYTSLFYTSIIDPGILPRYKDIPSDDWRWNDQAQSFIPPKAVYEPGLKVVIEKYHHTCIFTGTAIGKNNTFSFLCFVYSFLTTMLLDLVLVVYSNR